MEKRIATVISAVFNPFLVGGVIIYLVSLASAATILEAIKWTLIQLAVSILPVYLIVVYLLRKNRIDSMFIRIRQQRTQLYVLAAILAAAGSAVLYYLGAPQMVVAVFVAAFSGIAIFAWINLWWKISLHTAFVACLLTTLVIIYGYVGAVAVLLIPVITWARLELKLHTLAQTLAGMLLSVSIMVTVFYLFDLI